MKADTSVGFQVTPTLWSSKMNIKEKMVAQLEIQNRLIEEMNKPTYNDAQALAKFERLETIRLEQLPYAFSDMDREEILAQAAAYRNSAAILREYVL